MKNSEEFILSSVNDIDAYSRNPNALKGKSIIIKFCKNFNKISDVVFMQTVEFIFDNEINHIHVNNVTFSDSFLIWDLEISNKKVWLKFEWCEFKKDFRYDDRNYAHVFDIITFSYCTFNWLTVFEWIKCDQLNFNPLTNQLNSGCSFENNVWFKKIDANINFLSANFNGILSFLDLKPTTTLNISKWIIKWIIKVESLFKGISIKSLIRGEQDGIIPKIDILSKNENNTSTIEITKIKNLDELIISWLDWASLGSIILDKYYMSWWFVWLLLIYNLTVDKLTYKSSTITPSIAINNVTFWMLDLDDVNLWKAIFNNSVIRTLRLIGASFDDCKFNWCDLPSKINELDDNSIMKDSYRQLKFAMDKNWNHTEADKFYQREKEMELKILDESKLKLKEIFSWEFWILDSGNISKKIPLVFWKILTDFWNNWIAWFIFLNLFVLTSVFIKSLYGLFVNWSSDLFNQSVSQYTQSVTIDSFWYWLFVFWFSFYSFSLVIRFFDWLTKKSSFISMSLLILIWYFLYDTTIFSEFVKLLINPFYWFKDFIENVDKMSALELIGFVIYKLLYWIILWHIVVALKRTTRR